MSGRHRIIYQRKQNVRKEEHVQTTKRSKVWWKADVME